MTRQTIRFSAALALAALLISCGGAPDAAGPGEAVEQFYRALNDGDYDSAKALYGTEAREVARWVEYVETAIEPEFQREFVAAMHLPHMSDPFPHLQGTLPAPSHTEPTSRDGRRRRRRRERTI